MHNPYNLWGNSPTQPTRRDQEWYPPYVQPSGGNYGGYYDPNPWTPGYAPLRTEREDALAQRLAQANGRVELLERNVQRLEHELTESRRKLYQWRINIRNGLITALSLFIMVWAVVSFLVQYPVLPWEMPSAIIHLLGLS